MVKWWIVLGVLVLGGIGAVFGGGEDDTPPSSAPTPTVVTTPDRAERIGDADGASAVCRQFVRRRLGSDDLDFSAEVARHVQGKVWAAAGNVDGGAQRFVCRVEFDHDDTWNLKRLQIIS